MSESYLDGLLDELVPTEPQARWDDVLHRAHRAQRRYMAVVIAVAALGLAACSWVAVKVFEGTPAPRPVQGTFKFSNQAQTAAGTRLGLLFPQADVAKAHGVLQVQTKDGPLDLWAAPATDGGVCFVVGFEIDMTANAQLGASNACVPAGNKPAINPSTFSESTHPYTIVSGHVARSITTAQIKLTNGQAITLPVVEQFFLGALPPVSTVASITGQDASGKTVATYKPRK